MVITLRARVHKYLWHHAGKEEAEKAQGEPEICPVVSVFQYFQCITFKVNGSVKVLLVKSFNWYFALAMVL